jgi:hypothetical protein
MMDGLSKRVLSESRWREARGLLRAFEDVPSVSARMSIQQETLIAIFAQRTQETNKKNHHRHKAQVSRYRDRWVRGESVLRIAMDGVCLWLLIDVITHS